MPAGTYTLDPKHTSVIFKVTHLGFSHFAGRFDHVEGDYTYQSDAPEKSDLHVTIFPNSIDTNDEELDNTLRSENWFDALKFPRATFKATKIILTGPRSADIVGDFTLHDRTHTLVLKTVLVGSGIDPLSGENVMGFSAIGTFNRSSFDMSNLEPFVSDEVTLEIDSEFDKAK